MSTEATRTIVSSYFDRISAGDIKGAFDLFEENAQISFMSRTAMSYTKSKSEVFGLMAVLGGLFPEGIQLSVDGITAEGERVAVEAHSYAKLVNGQIYNNIYHYAFEVRDGKIQKMREYCCTAHAMERLGPLLAEMIPAAGR